MPAPEQFYVPALIISVVGSSYGVAIGRPISQADVPRYNSAEVLPFNYPVTTTIFELFVSFVLIYVVLFISGFLRCTRRLKVAWYTPLHSLESLKLDNLYDLYDGYGENNGVQSEDTPFGNKGRVLIFKLLPLAVTVAGEAVSSSHMMFSMPLQIFILSRALVLPALFVLSSGLVSKHKLNKIILPGLMLSVSVAAAAYHPNMPVSQLIVFTGLVSAFWAAVWPMVVQQTDQSLVGLGNIRYKKIIICVDLLYYTSMLSTLLLLPVLLYSGEIGQIMRNCYILDSGWFWIHAFARALLRCILFSTSILLIKATSPTAATFVFVLVTASQTGLLTSSVLSPLQWVGLVGCGLAAIWCLLNTRATSAKTSPNINEAFWFNINSAPQQIIAIGTVILICLVGISPSLSTLFTDSQNRLPLNHNVDPGLAVPSFRGNDSYLGRRPEIGAVAGLKMLVNECRGSYEKMENVRKIASCLQFLSSKQDVYLSIPKSASKLRNVYTIDNVELERNQNVTVCDGPLIPYHIWWSGLPTWRIELFIKSYFYTQNYGCSRLWIWIDTDHNPGALAAWISDLRFDRFQALVNRGDIILKEWRLPTRVPLFGDVDPLDKARYYSHPSPPNSMGEQLVADCIIRDSSGREWLQLNGDENQITFFKVAVSDAARLVILHLYGGVYLDADMILLRDLRPLLLADIPFAERWGAKSSPELYNNALVSLPANSSMSSYLLRGGARQNMVFHFTVLARMLVKEGMDDRGSNGLMKLETAFFDPVFTDVDDLREGRCAVPCLTKFEQIFQGAPIENEWEGLDQQYTESPRNNNRTMENFFRGGYAYHIHNQWDTPYEPQSWLDVITNAHDGFFSGGRVNPYGEHWSGRVVAPYGS